MIGLGVLVLSVQEPVMAPPPSSSSAGSRQAVLGLLGDARVRALVVAGVVLGLATVSDGFVYLAVQRRASLPARAAFSPRCSAAEERLGDPCFPPPGWW